MKKSYLIMTAIASVALVSCSNEEYFGDPGGLTGERAISFDMSTPAMTRDEKTGEAAAKELDYSFQVYATKTVGTGEAAVTSNVFAHDKYSTTATGYTPYWAWYVENTAGKTNSNLNNWEYVGGTGTHGKTGYEVNLENAQTIKYWDRSAASYSFMAFKAKPVGTPAASAIISNVTPSGFTVTGTPDQLAKLYVADKEIVTNTANGSGNVYGSPVRFTFRNFVSKIRFGIYENIPGYSVKIDKVYYDTGTNEKNSTSTFGVTGSFSGNAETSYGFSVTYDADGRAKGSHSSGDAQNYFETENSTILSADAIGTTATGATYDQAAGAYSIIMPDPNNGTGMTLKVDVTLTSEGGSGETIKLTSAIATVPAKYCQWKSNFAYTYLFKISDLTKFGNELLCPITLDAVVVDDGQGEQNTITVVEDPSITTYQNGDIVNDYAIAGGDIFATVSTISEGNVVLNSLVTTGLETVGNAALYTITLAGQTSFTEAEIQKALLVRTSAFTETTIEGRNGITLTPAKKANDDNLLELTHTIVTASGDITVSTGEAYKAAKFTPATGTNYAFVYTVEGSSNDNKDTKYEAVPNLTVGESSVAGLYRDFNLTATTGDAQASRTYYEMVSGTPTAKSVFLGQGPNNLFTRTGDDPSNYVYTAASGYAVTNTTYYYTTDGGNTYNLAANIAYASFAEATDLYTFNEGTNEYTLKTDAAPVPGTAYYQKTTSGGVDTYTYCVILPEQVNGLYEYTDGGKNACMDGEKAIAGKKYYDRYEMFKGKYAVKVIKVQ